MTVATSQGKSTARLSSNLGGGALGTPPEIAEITPADLLDRHDHQDVGRTELVVDDGALAEGGAEPQIALEEGWQRLQRHARIDRLGRQAVHRHEAIRQGARRPARL